MKKIIYIMSSILLISSIVSIELLYSDDDEHGYKNKSSYGRSKVDFEPVNNDLYQSECSECHFGYSRGMLPERSWRLLMNKDSLLDHFDESIELDETDRLSLIKYLTTGSSDKSSFKRSRKLNRSIRRRDTPIEITKIRYIIKKHDEIPDRDISGNSKVVTLGNCSACHQRAEKGIYEEEEVEIPK